MKKIILFMFVCLLFHNEMKGNPSWIPIDNSNNGKCISILTIESNENVYKARIKIHGYYDTPVIVEDTTYHLLSFDDPASLSFIGEPSLPVISRLIALYRGESFEVNIMDEIWSDTLAIGQIMPYQRSVLETEEDPPFEKNDSVYNGNTYQTEITYIGDLQKWRGINNRMLNICPINYMPREGGMSVLTDFVLELRFDTLAMDSPLETNDLHLFLNKIDIPEEDQPYQMDDYTDSYDYLIVAGNIPGILECPALANFQKWKALKGYRTKVVSTNTIGATNSQIKQYISNEYPKGVKYVLFIGDSDKVPLYLYHNVDINKNAKSDYWYGCMDGDNDVEADICIGRFSTNDLSEFTNMVNKTISYENAPRSYGNEVLLVAHKENAPGKYQECLETIRTSNYIDSISFTKAYGASSLVGGNDATNALVISEINDKKNIINYRGHGTYNQWIKWNTAGESFYNTHIDMLDSLTNDIYFCIACSNGNIDGGTCFMETFTRSNHGAAGIIAATEPSYTYANHSFNQYLFSKLLNEGQHNIGDLNIAAHLANFSTYKNTAIYNAFSYLCGCDPSLEIWTKETNDFNDYKLLLNGQSLSIDSGEDGGYKICVVNEEDSLISVINSDSSLCSIPAPTENIYIVLNKHNYVPRIIYINVTDNYIQNKVFNNSDIQNYYINNVPIHVGYDVTDSIPYGNVIVESGNKLNISKSNGVMIKNGFECKLGSELEIK